MSAKTSLHTSPGAGYLPSLLRNDSCPSFVVSFASKIQGLFSGKKPELKNQTSDGEKQIADPLDNLPEYLLRPKVKAYPPTVKPKIPKSPIVHTKSNGEKRVLDSHEDIPEYLLAPKAKEGPSPKVKRMPTFNPWISFPPSPITHSKETSQKFLPFIKEIVSQEGIDLSFFDDLFIDRCCRELKRMLEFHDSIGILVDPAIIAGCFVRAEIASKLTQLSKNQRFK